MGKRNPQHLIEQLEKAFGKRPAPAGSDFDSAHVWVDVEGEGQGEQAVLWFARSLSPEERDFVEEGLTSFFEDLWGVSGVGVEFDRSVTP